MRNLLALLAFVVLTFVGVGWYLGWYKVHTAPTENGHRKIDIDVNSPKITEDLKKGKEKIKDILTRNDGPVHQNVTPGDLPPTGFEPSEDGGFLYPPTSFAPPPVTPPVPPTTSLPPLPPVP